MPLDRLDFFDERGQDLGSRSETADGSPRGRAATRHRLWQAGESGGRMVFRFGAFDIDTAARELRRDGRPVAVQPRVFDVLAFLVQHRDHVVSKEELLAALWPDVAVTDASVERAVSLARAAIGDDGRAIRTVPKHGYRFVAAVAAGPPVPDTSRLFQPRFVSNDGVHIAYHTIGQGPHDVVVVPGWVFPMQALLDHPDVEAWVRRLSTVGRVVLFDKRGTGLSDRVKDLPAIEQRVDDLRAVLDAIGSTSATIVGLSEGGPLSIVFAASFPDRVAGLVLCGAFARWTAAPDYPHGWPPETVAALRAYIGSDWGRGDTIRAIVASRATDPGIAAWAARTEQAGASPGAALELLAMNLAIDVRPLLPAVHVPTVVLHSRGDPVIAVENARYLASHLPRARLVETKGRDHVCLFEDADTLMDALEWLRAQPGHEPSHVLVTLMAVETGAEPVDADVLAVIAASGGTPAGVRDTWIFDGPQRAIRCAEQVLAHLAARGRRARAGVHAGEVVREPAGLSGHAIDLVIAMARSAADGEVRVSQVVRDLVHGASLHFVPCDGIDLPDGRGMPLLRVVNHPG